LAVDILAAHICDIFNCIFDSGFFPERWTEWVIVPLHKKGDKNNVKKLYRHYFSKLYVEIIYDNTK
jgi:hypothetical protein